MNKKHIIYTFLILATIGFIDSLYLAVSHFVNNSVVCNTGAECDLVLTSEYATIFGIPVAIFGVIYYLIIVLMASNLISNLENIKLSQKMYMLTPVGFIASMWFVYLQLFVIHSICIYCMISATASTLLFILGIYSCVKLKSHPIVQP
jgi:uncharacterized membrane protein